MYVMVRSVTATPKPSVQKIKKEKMWKRMCFILTIQDERQIVKEHPHFQATNFTKTKIETYFSAGLTIIITVEISTAAYLVVAFSSRARIMGGCLTIHFLLALLFF